MSLQQAGRWLRPTWPSPSPEPVSACDRSADRAGLCFPGSWKVPCPQLTGRSVTHSHPVAPPGHREARVLRGDGWAQWPTCGLSSAVFRLLLHRAGGSGATGHFQSRWVWPQGTEESLLRGGVPFRSVSAAAGCVESPLLPPPASPPPPASSFSEQRANILNQKSKPLRSKPLLPETRPSAHGQGPERRPWAITAPCGLCWRSQRTCF